jgi:PHD/YefM family antitoxin component YafN of YafNO toxin-antitoxin module
MKATATEVKNRFGELAVLLSADEYERLSALEDRYWGEQAREAAKTAYLGSQQTVEAIETLLHKPDPDEQAEQ